MISSSNRHAITVTDDQVGPVARPPGEGRPVFLPVTARPNGPSEVRTHETFLPSRRCSATPPSGPLDGRVIRDGYARAWRCDASSNPASPTTCGLATLAGLSDAADWPAPTWHLCHVTPRLSSSLTGLEITSAPCEWGELRTNYGPRRSNSAHINGQPWTPAINGSRSTTLAARSGGQGVASSNLASPTSDGGLSRLIRAAFIRPPGHPRRASEPGELGPDWAHQREYATPMSVTAAPSPGSANDLTQETGSRPADPAETLTVAPGTLIVRPTCTPRVGPCARSVRSWF